MHCNSTLFSSSRLSAKYLIQIPLPLRHYCSPKYTYITLQLHIWQKAHILCGLRHFSFIFRFFPLPIHFRCILDLQNMTDVSTILGIALIGVGAASAVYGAILCYTTKVGLKRCIFRIRNVSRLDMW